MKNKNYILDILSSAIIFLGISLLTFLGFYGNAFFRDFPIIFDGAYRISIGLKPFIDFALFPIPVPFYMQAILNWIFGPGLIALAFHSIILSSIVSIIFYFIVKKEFNRPFSILLALLFFYSFIGIIVFPWYNQIALFFFLLNFFLLYISLKKHLNKQTVYIMSAILTLLSFFSKMEIGAMHFVLVAGYLLISEKNRKKVLSNYIGVFILLTILIQKFIGAISTSVSNAGVSSFSGKIHQIFSIFTIDLVFFSFTTYILIFLIFMFIKNYKKFKLLGESSKKLFYLILMINLITLGTTIFSGLPVQTKIFALPLNLFLIYIFIKENYSEGSLRIKKSTLKIVASFLIFILIFTQFNGIANYQYSFFSSPTRQAYNIFFLENTKYERDSFGCYAGSFYERGHLEDLNKIRDYIQESNNDFVVMGEYQFLYCDFKTLPPKGLPLWLHESITFNKEKDLPWIEEYFGKNRPKLVIEQIYAQNSTREEFGDYLRSKGYTKIDTVSSELSEINIFKLK